MYVSVAGLRHHFEYSIWANQRLLEAARKLTPEQLTRDFGTSDRSVLGTLTHIYGSEAIWLDRVRGVPPVRPGELTLERLLAEWPGLCQRWTAWLNTLTNADPERRLDYQDLAGNPHSEALWQILLHVVNHSTHHRGQVAGFLRSMGLVPPSLDFIRFVRERE